MTIKSKIICIKTRQLQRAQKREMIRLAETPNELSSQKRYCKLGLYLSGPVSQPNVLELGCGPGKYVALMGAMGYNVIGVDPCSFSEWKELQYKNSTFIPNVYAEKLPFDDDIFDATLCLGSLLYFNNPCEALSEIKRVTKKGGTVVIRTVNKENYYTLRTGNKLDPSSRQLYTIAELKDLLTNAGFEIEDLYTWGFWPPWFPNLWWWFSNVILPSFMLDILSNMINEKHRINIIIKAKNL